MSAGAPFPPPSSAPSSAAGAGVVVRVGGRTDVGRTREHNEDAFLVADLATDAALAFPEDARGGRSGAEQEVRVGPRGMLFVVADGLGGAAAGELASHMAVEGMLRELRTRIGPEQDEPLAFALALRDAALATNAAIHLHAVEHPELRGMGTTLTAAALRGDTLYVAQVGDSRAYVVRDGVAWQITKDQSLMQKLVEAGEITPEQAETSSRRNIILQALGPDVSVKIDVTHQPVRRGDLLLLCSDGLSGQVRVDEIARYAAEEDDLSRLCARLVDRANETGGPDNITVIAARFEGPGVAQSGHADEVGHRTFELPPHPDDTNAPMDRAAQAFVEAAIARRTGGHRAVARPAAVTPSAPEVPPLPPEELDARRHRAHLVRAALAALAAGMAVGLAWHYLM